jgi:predicted RNA-binding Zn ribbon-like protein
MDRFRSGNGAAWLDLLSTHEGRYREHERDLLADQEALAGWLASAGLSPSEPITEHDLSQVRALRESLHRLAVASLSGRTPRPTDIRMVNRAAAGDRGVQLRGGSAGLRITAPRTFSQVMSRLAHEAATDLAGPRHGRLRACGDDTCSGIFLDLTGRRRWCTDERCGNRLRVRAHRARMTGDPRTSRSDPACDAAGSTDG